MNTANNSQQHLELGQFIPLAYHYNMLTDEARMTAFQDAMALAVTPGCRVLELGGGTAALSFFAAQRGANVCCVERNPELVHEARRILALNPGGERVTVIEADAFDYLPAEPVDVVICEMLHVGMLREKQIAVIDSFKQRYRAKFGEKLPRFIPEAFFQEIGRASCRERV
jgi:protein arginine N-methyltransferase 1